MTAFLIAFLMLMLSFFFSGMEIAFISSNLLKIELKTKQGDRAAKILSGFKKQVPAVIITILIGNNLALVVFTLMVNDITEPWLTQGLGLSPDSFFLIFTFIQAVIATLIILFFAEYIPKAIFRRNADTLVYPFAYVLQLFFWILRLPVWVVNRVSKFLLRILFRVREDNRVVELSKRDLDQYLQEVVAASETLPVEDLDTEMLTNALAFKETKARECMIPRTEIVAVAHDTTVEEMIEVFVESRLSKVIVYGENLDNVKGFVHSIGLFSKPDTIQSIIQPVLVVPESMSADVLLAELTENQRSVAIVVDEFGGTSGMITMEDLVEEVFGEIEDEHDKEEEVEEDMVKIMEPNGSMLLGARLEIDDLNESLDLDLPKEEYYTTLGGLIMYVAEDIPVEEQEIELGPYMVTVIKATPTRIISVRLSELGEG